MSEDKEIKYLYKPDKKTLERARKQLKKIQKIIKEKGIPYISSEKMADLLKDREKNQLIGKEISLMNENGVLIQENHFFRIFFKVA